MRAKKNQFLSISSVIIDRAAKSLIVVKREKDPYYGAYSLPGGKLEMGELIQEGQIRESLEETGYVVEPYKFSQNSKKPVEYLTETLYHDGTIYLIMTNLFQIVEKNESILEPDCEFEFFGCKPGLEIPYYRDVLTEDNTTPNLIECLNSSLKS